MLFSNTTFFTKQYLKEKMLPELCTLGKFDISLVSSYDVYFSDKLLGGKRVIYPSFRIGLGDGKVYEFKLYKERLWLHHTNFFPDIDFLNILGLSLLNDTFYIQGDIQIQLLLKRNNIFNYLPKNAEYLLFTLYSYSESPELPYVFKHKETNLDMFLGYFIFSAGSILSIPKHLYFEILNSTL